MHTTVAGHLQQGVMEVCIAGGSPPSFHLCHERLKWPSQQSRAVVLLYARRQQVKYGCALHVSCSPLFMPCTTTQPLTSSPLDAVTYPAPPCGVRCTGRETACSSVRQVDQTRASARAQVPALPDDQQQNGRSHTSEAESGKGTCELPAAESRSRHTEGWDPREPRTNEQRRYEFTRKQLVERLVWICAPALMYEVV
jgi:hypothetical protein